VAIAAAAAERSARSAIAPICLPWATALVDALRLSTGSHAVAHAAPCGGDATRGQNRARALHQALAIAGDCAHPTGLSTAPTDRGMTCEQNGTRRASAP
jgi:hypothetical protein